MEAIKVSKWTPLKRTCKALAEGYGLTGPQFLDVVTFSGDTGYLMTKRSS